MTRFPSTDRDEFARAAQTSHPGILRELWDLLRYNKKWWLTPVIGALVLVGLLVLLSSTAAAPFIYTLF